MTKDQNPFAVINKNEKWYVYLNIAPVDFAELSKVHIKRVVKTLSPILKDLLVALCWLVGAVSVLLLAFFIHSYSYNVLQLPEPEAIIFAVIILVNMVAGIGHWIDSIKNRLKEK